MNSTRYRECTQWTIGPFEIYGDWSNYRRWLPPHDGKFIPEALTITATYQSPTRLGIVKHKWKKIVSWISPTTGSKLTLWQYPGKRTLPRIPIKKLTDWPWCCGAVIEAKARRHQYTLALYKYKETPAKGSYYKNGIGFYLPKINESTFVLYKKGGFKYYEG